MKAIEGGRRAKAGEGEVRMETAERGARIRHVLLVILLLNLGVALAKIICGSAFSSESVRADGIHSLFDSAGNVVGLAGIVIAARPADRNHPYGHVKYETFASLFIGMLLVFAAYEVGWNAVQSLMSGESHVVASPVAFAVMVVTLVINLGVTTYERRQGRALGSAVLDADAKHTLSDALVSIGVIAGLVLVKLGFPEADAVAALVVTIAIFSTALSVLKDVTETLSDEARVNPERIRSYVLSIEGVAACHNIRTRGPEDEVFADLHILVDPDMSISRAHAIGNAAEALIKERIPQIREVLVHLEPATAQELHEDDVPLETEKMSS